MKKPLKQSLKTLKKYPTTMTPLTLAAPNEAIMEMREASPAHYLVRIGSFSLLYKHKTDKYETGEFVAGGYKWKLIIYPNGQGDSLGYVSVYLGIVDTTALPANWEANVVFSICLFNQISCNYLYSLGRSRRFLKMKKEWGFAKFISKNDLIDPSNGYLIDDSCVFGAEVFVNENKAVTECLTLKRIAYTPFKLEFKISDFSKLKDLWASDVFTAGGHKWNINVYPNGIGDASRGWLSAFLVHVASNDDAPSEGVKARFTICIKNQTSDKDHIERTCSHWFPALSTEKEWGWKSFIELDSLNDPKKGFIVEDCFLVEIEFRNFCYEIQGPETS